MARTAYSGHMAPTRTERGLEYDLFARVTRALKTAQAARGTDFPAFAKALHDNTRLWSVLAADVARDDNELPAQLRARLFYLYEFTQQHGRKALAGEADVEVLIDINTAVMRGLRSQGGAE